jgi:hypothetical protein
MTKKTPNVEKQIDAEIESIIDHICNIMNIVEKSCKEKKCLPKKSKK